MSNKTLFINSSKTRETIFFTPMQFPQWQVSIHQSIKTVKKYNWVCTITVATHYYCERTIYLGLHCNSGCTFNVKKSKNWFFVVVSTKTLVNTCRNNNWKYWFTQTRTGTRQRSISGEYSHLWKCEQTSTVAQWLGSPIAYSATWGREFKLRSGQTISLYY